MISSHTPSLSLLGMRAYFGPIPKLSIQPLRIPSHSLAPCNQSKKFPLALFGGASKCHCWRHSILDHENLFTLLQTSVLASRAAVCWLGCWGTRQIGNEKRRANTLQIWNVGTHWKGSVRCSTKKLDNIEALETSSTFSRTWNIRYSLWELKNTNGKNLKLSLVLGFVRKIWSSFKLTVKLLRT